MKVDDKGYWDLIKFPDGNWKFQYVAYQSEAVASSEEEWDEELNQFVTK